ncbi:hypothetical protein HK105_208908 [Polyrhizophydium stewartii]|uniref:Pre-mRNA-splicing factor SPF27 n=1 Tax=Polyrhizophydium stewartii TaxID=2732419 RepID=A0ABR4MWN4_9FUNG
MEDVVVDSLPYIDPDYDPAVVQALIDEELRTHSARRPSADSIAHSEPALFKDRPGLRSLLESAAAGNKIHAIDTQRFRLEGPVDGQAWDRAIANATSQLEHQNQRLVNLELVSKFGANAWLIHNYQLEAGIRVLKRQLEICLEETQAVNKARKSDQIHAKPTLSSLSERWTQLINSIVALRMENDRLDAVLSAHGISPLADPAR